MTSPAAHTHSLPETGGSGCGGICRHGLLPSLGVYLPQLGLRALRRSQAFLKGAAHA